jgi:hypothetical protein
VKRQRATQLAEQMLSALHAGREEWPLNVVTEVHVFGSYARGAIDPRALDIDVEIDRRDDRWLGHFSNSAAYGRDPHSIIRRALVGGVRSCQVLFDARSRADFPLTLLWQRGDTLTAALDRLHAIPVDDCAGRAPRDAMLPEFDGLDRWMPRPYREALAAAVADGAVTLHRLELPEARVVDPLAEEHIRRRWTPTSPLYRAAHAALAHLEDRGIDPAQVHLHGRDVRSRETPYFVGFAMRYFPSIPACLTEYGGREWTEIVHPTRSLPLHALVIEPARSDLLTNVSWR